MTVPRFDPNDNARLPLQARSLKVSDLRHNRRRGRMAFCTRCGRRRSLVSRHRKLWVALRALWFVFALGAIPLLVLLAPIAFISWPPILCFFYAIGPLNDLASSPARCGVCKYVVDAPPASATSPRPEIGAEVATVVPLSGGWRRRRPHRSS